ncbi:zinc finger, CCHC-type containing protein, partial [Tanacetum coccineum]
MTTSSANNSVFRGFFEKQKLTGPNFIDWYRQLRIVLSIEDKLNYLEQPLPPAPVAPEGQLVAPEITTAHTAWIKGSKEIAGLMLMTMEPEIQRNLENLHAYEMLQELKTLFAQQAEQELLQTMRDFHSCKWEEGQSISSMGKIVNELHAMLKLHEQTLPKNNASDLHVIRAGKGKNKLAYAPKPKIPPPPKREDPTKDSICHEYGETGHWKRNCPQYLSELLKKKKLSLGAINSDGLINRFVKNTIQVSRNNMVYFSAIPRDGIFEIDLSNSYANDSFMYVVSNKRAKLDLNSTLLWHCRLGHISKKRIEKLQHDGLLNSIDLRAFEKCVS